MNRTLWTALAAVITVSGCGYNTIQRMDEEVEESRANIETELIRRNDLIPNLVATVDEAAAFEERTFTRVAEARAGLERAREDVRQAVEGDADLPSLGAASDELARNLRLFLNVSVEAYPTLTANQSFRALQDELTETENRLAFARREYNERVRSFNSYVRQFPQVITAKVIGADRKEPFEAPAGVEEPPTVDFGDG
ncbi:MAG: LemA family protein [Gemmatimonadota bacterium]